ncbi:carboxypeptidase-like regulatory domain-containing protein [Myxococcota bacterium]|nr:carboxypeptidase-like regulatory domain-containing protein [Myxococcota bacterium]
MKLFSLFIPLMMVLAFACDDGKRTFSETVTVTPVDPLGTVGGVVFDASTDAPLAGVTVTVISGGYTFNATTDDAGIFQLTDIPATGGVFVMYSLDGFLPARIQTNFPVAPGNVPYENPSITCEPIWMFGNTGTFQVRLLDPTGVPISQVPLQLVVPAAYYSVDQWGNVYFRGDVNRVANTNAMGLAQFRDIPELPMAGSINFPNVRIYVPEIDLDGDGNPEFASTTRNFDLHTTGDTIQVIRLSAFVPGDLSVSASNNSYFTATPTVPGQFSSGDSIYVLFNREPDADSLSVVLREFAQDGASWPLSPTLTGNQISFTLPDGLVGGEMYLLTVYANTEDFGNTYTRTVPVFITPTEALTVSMARENPMVINSPVIVTFNQWVGTGSQFYTWLTGNDGVIYFVYDLNSSGIIGDDFSEYGYTSTNVGLESLEVTPTWVPGLAVGRTGFSKRWRFSPPAAAVAGTSVQFTFPFVMSSAYLFHTPAGDTIAPMTGSLP